MNRHPKTAQPRPKNRTYRQALERLDESLEQNTSVSNTEKLQLPGRHLFGALWHDPEPNDSEVLP